VTRKKRVKGSIIVSEIKDVTPGCEGAKHLRNALTILTPTRTLELEASDIDQAQDWLEGVSFLVSNPQ